MPEVPSNAPPALPPDIVDEINQTRGGFNEQLGLRFVTVTYDEVVAELVVGPQHHQPYGLVHGGVYAAMIETLASTGAAINAAPHGRHTVGLENSTSFVRAMRAGTLRGVARPITRGRRTQVWQVTLSDGDGRVAATGRVRMLCLERGTAVAGETVQIKGRSIAPSP